MAALPAERPLEIAAFLDRLGWGEAALQPFDGDFSPRRYARLTKPDGGTAILMDADASQKTLQFASIAKLLRNAGLHAPEIYAAEPEQGLVLMQDFGNRNIGALLDAGTDRKAYFLRAAELLAQLHEKIKMADIAPLDLPLFNSSMFVTQANLFLDHYFPYARQRAATEIEREDFRAALRAVLRRVEAMPQSLLLRDFMPDNLMALPNEDIGLLDFQDAGIGPVAYDLASLCEEVRRDGGYALLPDVMEHYRKVAQSTLPQADLMRGCAVLSAQRHLRILGIIAQLANHGRRDKLAYLPRIKLHLAKIMQSPHLMPMREFMRHFEEVG